MAAAWLAGLFIVLLLLLLSWPGNAQTSSVSAPTLSSGSLQEAEAILTTLSSRLVERKQQVNELQLSLLRADLKLDDFARALTALEERLQAAQESLSTSQADLRATLNLLDALSKRYEELEKRWNEYRDEALRATVALERRLLTSRAWSTALGISTLILAIVSAISFAK